MSKSTIPASTGGEGSHSNGSYPPRPSKSNRTPAKKSTKGTAKSGNQQRSASAANKAECVPHVVRVAFLGVAGLQANPIRESASTTAAPASIATDGATANDGTAGSTDNDTHATSSTSAAPSHPSLLIPLPSHLRVVATVSRTKTARGIPSGMSRVLTASSGNQKSAEVGGSIPSIPSIVDTNSSMDFGIGCGVGNTDKKDLRSPKEVSESRIRSRLSASGSELSAADEVDNVGVEVVRPTTPGTSMLDSGKEPSQEDEEPERFVALWSDNDSAAKSSNTSLHYSNSLAFEADLRPSTSSAAKDAPGDATASTAYAPKSFCVTVGLVPDTKQKNKNKSQAATNEDDGEPTFAIPIGFTNLIVKGNETLDGKRIQVDLPLSTLSSAIAQVGGNSNTNSMGAAFPLIELTGGAADEKADSKGGKKSKKKSLVKRMFSRKQPPSSSSDAAGSVYNGSPRSIYHLGRPPNARERSLFVDRYSVDPSGDAVMRVGLEVFARGSELEKVFRHKNRLRKEQKKRKTAASSFAVGRGGPVVSPQSIGARSRSGDSCDSSLFDSSDSDDDSIFSQSFFTFDSNTEGDKTWDDGSTMFTDISMADSLSYTDGTSRATKEEGVPKSPAGRFFANLINCTGPTNCIVNDTVVNKATEKERRNEFDPTNIEQVASAVADITMVTAGSPQDNSLLVNEASRNPESASSRHEGETTTIDTPKNEVLKKTTIEGGVAMYALPAAAGNTSKKTHKKTNSSVTYDSAATALAGTVMASNNNQLNESIVSAATNPVGLEVRKLETSLTSITLENEVSPLATIKHVHNVRGDDPVGERDTAEQSCEGEVEYTLEQHKSR